jgi:hypothetical protein
MIFDRLTWLGFMITALGWTLLLSAPHFVELFTSVTGRPNAYLNAPAIAECTILSGFGIAILGALQTGFEALNKFFQSALERTGNARSKAKGQLSPQQKKIVERGRIKNRSYVLYLDGTVEVETMLGRRIFSSLQDAQEFIA